MHDIICKIGSRSILFVKFTAAGDSWVDNLPLLDEDGDIEWRTALFICSFISVMVWVLLQVNLCDGDFCVGLISIIEISRCKKRLV